MATTLMLNPKKRGKRRASRRSGKAPSAKQRANWARFAKMARGRAARSSAPKRKRRASRRTNPIIMSRTYSARRSRARRRNPIRLGGGGGGSLFNLRGYIAPLKEAAIMGAGAVAMDMAYGYATPYLPAMLQRVPGRVGLGDLAKALLTIAFGKVLAKPTRGLSMKAAMGALVVQGRDIALTLLPRPAAAATVSAVPSPGLPFQGGAGLRRNWTGTGMNSGIGAIVRTGAGGASGPMVLPPPGARLSAFVTGSPQLVTRR